MRNIFKNSIKVFALLVMLCPMICFPANAKNAKSMVCPGQVLILTEDGYTPSMVSLFSDSKSAGNNSYEDWYLEPISDIYSSKFTGSKKATGSSFLDNLYILKFPDSILVTEVMSRIKKSQGIRFIEPDYKLELFRWPTDSYFKYQWYLHNSGQQYYAVERYTGDNNDVLYMATGTADEDLNLEQVYNSEPADAMEVIVAVLDSGVDVDHPDLAENIFINTAEIQGNDIDDDNNGLVDDYFGWDFSGNSVSDFGSPGDNDPADYSGHGTHVAGLIGAVRNNRGISGYPGKIKILPVKIFPRAFQSVAVPAIIYAVDMGAKVLNLSWGSPYEMDILHEAIKYARDRGCLPVAAIGNSGNSMTIVPAAFEETFTVGGTNSDGFVTYFSSYGPFLDIMAPGQDILSLRAFGTDLYGDDEPGLRIIGDNYILADGTSMSAPLVAGAAAMLWSFNPGLDAESIADALRQTADDITDPWDTGENLPGYDTLSGWGRMNVGNAFSLLRSPSVYISTPANQQIVNGAVNVGISILSGYSGPAVLYMGQGKTPETWIKLHEATASLDDPEFYVWNTDGLNGYYSLRLEYDNGDFQRLCRVINSGAAIISHPADGQELVYLTTISGSLYGADFDSAVISTRAEDSSSFDIIFSGPGMYFDEYIVDWPVFDLETEHYYLKFEAFCNEQLFSDSIRVLVTQTMRTGFPRSHPGYIAFSPGVADIDGDGRKEIVVGSDKGVYAYHDNGELLSGFPVATDYDMRSIPAFDDVDGDGLLDIIISGRDIFACYNHLGRPIAGWPLEASTGLTYYTFPIATATELFNFSDSVAIYMSRFGEVRAYKYNGDSYFYSLNGLYTALDPNIFDTLKSTGLSVPFVTVADLENDNSAEVIAVYGTTIDESGVYIWNGRNGMPLPGWEKPQARNIRRSGGGTLADLDENGTLEIIVVGDDTNNVHGIWAITNGRDDLPGWPVYIEAVDGWVSTSPVCVDFDNDGRKEVLVAYYSWDFSHIYAFNHDGTPCIDNPSHLPDGLFLTTQNTLGHLIVADIDGNGIPNIISRGGYLFPYSTSYEKIFAWEPDATITPGFPIITPTPPGKVYSTPITPVVDDLDNDGSTEVIMCGDYNQVFVWNLGTPFNEDKQLWPKFHGDIKNTGVNLKRGVPTGVDNSYNIISGKFAILGNYPNPFNPVTTIQFSLDRGSDIRLEIYNILGQKVKVVLDEYSPAGSHQAIWRGDNNEGNDVASGVYLVSLSDDKRNATRKILLIR